MTKLDSNNPVTPTDIKVMSAAFVPVWRGYSQIVNRHVHAQGFYDASRELGTTIALMHSELSEALEAEREGNPPSKKAEGFSCLEEELADLVIRVMDTSHEMSLDVAGAIRAKMLHNLSRPYKHGKEF